jgi:transcriptional regulator with XRE-family HTH domain
VTTTRSKANPPARLVFAAALRAAREEAGLSQEELADEAGVHRTYVGQLERGEKNVSIDSMEKLASALNRTLPELLVTPKQGKADVDRLFKRWQSR